MKTGKREEKGGTRGREDGRAGGWEGEGRRKKKKNRPPEDRYRAPLWKKGRAGRYKKEEIVAERMEEEEEEKEELRGRGSLRYDTVSRCIKRIGLPDVRC